MAPRLIGARRLGGTRAAGADRWRTVSGWMWTAYFLAVASGLLWWLA
jgi:hypothetical protein